MRWTIQDILDATEGRLVHGRSEAALTGISIDSRTLTPGEAFVAIRGKRLDGHDFAGQAATQGAGCLVVARDGARTNGAAALPTVLVRDTTEALGRLARFHRRRLGVPVVGVTGSCGKTTTKELIAHVLGTPETVLKTSGTQNNHIGVPLTLLRLHPGHRVAVVELGSNHPGEIAHLASLTEPDVGVLTNVGPVHLEFFGSIGGVLQEKVSLLATVPASGSVVLPGDQLDVCLEAQRRVAPGVRMVRFGSTDRCDLQAVDVQRSAYGMMVRLRDDLSPWPLPLVGYHNVENALAATACAWTLGVPLSVMKKRLETFEPVPMRSQVVRCQGLTILNDCYNANPLSVARALETLRDFETRRKIAIVGDMLELGAYAPSAHQAIGRLATQLGIDAVMAVGTFAAQVAEGARGGQLDRILVYRTVSELLEELPRVLQRGDGLLIKGSRAMNLERVTEFLLTQYRSADGDPTTCAGLP